MDRAEQLSLLSGIAADQWGLVTSAQAKAAGLNGVQLLRLTEAALVENVGRGVYLLPAAGQPQHLEIKVAWLRLQPTVPAWQRSADDPDSGVVSHASACELHGLGDIPAPQVELTVPRRRVTKDPSVRLRVAALESAEITLVDGLPVTTPRRTILDLLTAKADGGHVGGVIAEAERRDLVSTADLAPEVARFARRYGMPRNSDGMSLIDHLVAQAGESLRSEQLERATEAGFTSALQLMRTPGFEEILRQQHTPALAHIQRLVRDAAMPSLQLQHAIEAINRASGMKHINEAMYANLREAMGPSLDFRRILREASQPTPAIQQAVKALHKLQSHEPAQGRRAIEPARTDDAPDENAET